MKYFAKIRYLGTEFHGFQVQPQERTVQGVLCNSLSEAFGAPCKVTGCSRTDAGVHANEFVVLIECDESTIPPDKLPVAVSRFLPNDLSLYYAREVSDDFHPRYDAVSKEYLYRIVNARVYDPFEFGRAWFLPRHIDREKLNRIKRAASYFIGEYDFSAFMSEGSDTEDTVRRIYYLDINMQDDLLTVKICANGFLYNMVRIIVGTLIECGYGRFEPEDMIKIIESRKRSFAGMTAPAMGLYLNKVNY